MNIGKTLNNLFLFIHVPFISEFCSGIINLLNLHQHSPNDSARGAGSRGGARGWVAGGGDGQLVKGLGYGYSFIVILISS